MMYLFIYLLLALLVLHRHGPQNRIQLNINSKLDFLKHVSLRAPQQFAEIFVHASHSQLLQAVVAMVDSVRGHYDHPSSVGVVSELAANG